MSRGGGAVDIEWNGPEQLLWASLKSVLKLIPSILNCCLFILRHLHSFGVIERVLPIDCIPEHDILTILEPFLERVLALTIFILHLHFQKYLDRISGLDKNLNSNLPFGQASVKVCLPEPISHFTTFKNFKIINDSRDFHEKYVLMIQYISFLLTMKSYLPEPKIYLSWTTEQEFFRALHM